MKKLLAILAPAALGAGVVACTTAHADETAAPAVLNWETVNVMVDSVKPMSCQTFTLVGDLRGVQRVAYNQLGAHSHFVDPADTLIELFPGYWAIGSPKFAQANGNDTITFQLMSPGHYRQMAYQPDGVHLVMTDGRIIDIDINRKDILDNPDSYGFNGKSRMPSGADIFAINEGIYSTDTAGVYQVIPSFKSVTMGGGVSDVNLADIEFKTLPEGVSENPEAYRITVGEGKMVVEADQKLWEQIRRRLAHNFGTETRLMPDAVIVDYPDYGYRGVMIDIARNYQEPAEIHRILDLMALYNFNTLHFHLIDDEAWRLEIKGLPELTEIGAHRGYTTASGDDPFLPRTYGGKQNGFLTQDDYIAILKHADSLNIAVIPEVESPGHARAAVIAMNHRAKRTGDDSWLLREPNDTSVYTSAQDYHDNIMNPALPGPYKVMDIVADEIIDMHKRAGVPLKAIHIGGDEVPRGGWSGSQAVKDLMEREGFTHQDQVHAYFNRKVHEIFKQKGIKLSGWQEVGKGHSEEYNAELAPDTYSVNCWATNVRPGQPLIPVQVAEAGFPVILSNVERFYLDMTYNYHPAERGLSWGGCVDEFTSLGGYPAEMAPGVPVVGLQGQLFAETLREPATLEMNLLPKMLGLAERAWNGTPTYSIPAFQTVISEEMPKWDADGYAYHVRQPGIKVTDGKFVQVNSPYRESTVRVTFDGSNPDENSLALPVDSVLDITAYNAAPTEVRARLWVNGHPSLVTIEKIAE
ncbi:MAG: family 20 glycosylhydrolase [Muribaculaceae bacterium]|nr:family 20 glycosylhydrolase [Muribaculaceae bacterium]